MATVLQPLTVSPIGLAANWMSLLALPAAVLVLRSTPPWVLMWALAVAIFAGFKWLTFLDSTPSASNQRMIGYLLAWPGLDADSFLHRSAAAPSYTECGFAAGKSLCGCAVLLTAANLSHDVHPLLVGWMGMIGVVFTLHFGLFHLLSCCWRGAGVDAPPLMHAPILAKSVSDFWGRRWNTPFRDVAQRYLFRPLVRHCGPAGAALGAFLLSGVIHDVVISLPARAGWGLPTAYFVIQWLAMLVERSGWGRSLLRGMPGRLFALLTVTLPLPLLFHTPFVERVVVPMLQALKEVLS